MGLVCTDMVWKPVINKMDIVIYGSAQLSEISSERIL